MLLEKIKEYVKKGYEFLKNLVTKLKGAFEKKHAPNKEFAIDHGVYGYNSVAKLKDKRAVIDHGIYGYSSVEQKDYVKNAQMTRNPNKEVNKKPEKLTRINVKTNLNEFGMKL